MGDVNGTKNTILLTIYLNGRHDDDADVQKSRLIDVNLKQNYSKLLFCIFSGTLVKREIFLPKTDSHPLYSINPVYN